MSIKPALAGIGAIALASVAACGSAHPGTSSAHPAPTVTKTVIATASPVAVPKATVTVTVTAPAAANGSPTAAQTAAPVGAAQTLAAMVTGQTTSDGATVTSATVGTTCTFKENGSGPGDAHAMATGSVLGVVDAEGINDACQWFASPISPQFWQNTGSYTLGIGELTLSDGTQYQALVVYTPDDDSASFVEAADPTN